MDGSTNAQNVFKADISGNPAKIQIGQKTWLCWGYCVVPYQGSTVKGVVVNLPVTAGNAGSYFPIVSLATNDPYWANIQLTAPNTLRTTTTFEIQSWILDEPSLTGSVLAFWMAVVTTS